MKKELVVAGSILAAMVADAADALTRQDLEQKLANLAAEPPPTKLAPGAMCYEVMAPPNRFEYTCGKCGEKTLYANAKDGSSHVPWQLYNTDNFRRLMKQIKAKGLSVELDESAFCRKCSKGATKKAFVMVLTGDDKTTHRVELKSTTDLQLILEFLEGKKKHHGETGGETPLKAHLPRLKELLGISQSKEK